MVARWEEFNPPSHLYAPALALPLTGRGAEGKGKWPFSGKPASAPCGDRQWDRVLSLPIWPRSRLLASLPSSSHRALWHYIGIS